LTLHPPGSGFITEAQGGEPPRRRGRQEGAEGLNRQDAKVAEAGPWAGIGASPWVVLGPRCPEWRVRRFGIRFVQRPPSSRAEAPAPPFRTQAKNAGGRIRIRAPVAAWSGLAGRGTSHLSTSRCPATGPPIRTMGPRATIRCRPRLSARAPSWRPRRLGGSILRALLATLASWRFNPPGRGRAAQRESRGAFFASGERKRQLYRAYLSGKTR
jgi:hypothetical protein